jgi:hypothetical protein
VLDNIVELIKPRIMDQEVLRAIVEGAKDARRWKFLLACRLKIPILLSISLIIIIRFLISPIMAIEIAIMTILGNLILGYCIYFRIFHRTIDEPTEHRAVLQFDSPCSKRAEGRSVRDADPHFVRDPDSHSARDHDPHFVRDADTSSKVGVDFSIWLTFNNEQQRVRADGRVDFLQNGP